MHYRLGYEKQQLFTLKQTKVVYKCWCFNNAMLVFCRACPIVSTWTIQQLEIQSTTEMQSPRMVSLAGDSLSLIVLASHRTTNIRSNALWLCKYVGTVGNLLHPFHQCHKLRRRIRFLINSYRQRENISEHTSYLVMKDTANKGGQPQGFSGYWTTDHSPSEWVCYNGLLVGMLMSGVF